MSNFEVDEDEVPLLVPAALSGSSTSRIFWLMATSTLTRRMAPRYRKAPKQMQKMVRRQRTSAIVELPFMVKVMSLTSWESGSVC